MKSLIIAFLIIPLSLIAQGQNQQYILDILPSENGYVKMTSVSTVENTAKNELYKRAYRWVVDNIRSAKDAIDYADTTTAQLVVKTNFDIDATAAMIKTTHTISCSIYIDIKDEKYRCVIKDFNIKERRPDIKRGYPPTIKDYQLETWLELKPNVNKKYAQEILNKLLIMQNSFANSMKKPIVSDGF